MEIRLPCDTDARLLPGADRERAREETIQLLWVLTGVGCGRALIAAAALAFKSRAIRADCA